MAQMTLDCLITTQFCFKIIQRIMNDPGQTSDEAFDFDLRFWLRTTPLRDAADGATAMNAKQVPMRWYFAVRARYGLKSSRVAFRKHLWVCIRGLNHPHCPADPDVCCEQATMKDETQYYSCILCYANDVMVMHETQYQYSMESILLWKWSLIQLRTLMWHLLMS